MNVMHLSLSNERFTPAPFAAAAREVMGGIDTDPASHYLANEHIQAKRFHGTLDETGTFRNGYVLKWKGKTFMNPPGGICDMYGQQVHRATKNREACTVTGSCGLEPGHEHKGTGSSAKLWWGRLASQWQRGYVTEAVFVGFTLEILRSTQSLPKDLVRPAQLPFCIPDSRMKFWEPQPDGTLKELKQPTHANVIVYLPPRDSSRRMYARSTGKAKLFKQVFSRFGEVRV